MIDITKIYYFVFGVLSIAGGLMGFLNKGSMPSLIAGGISGILLLLAGFLIPTKLQIALALGLIISVLLAGKFVPDYLAKKAFMPGGLMAILSVIGVILTLLAWFKK